jgi:hypothetical protein
MCKAYFNSIHSEPESNPSIHVNILYKCAYYLDILFLFKHVFQNGVEPLHKVFQTNALPVSYWNYGSVRNRTSASGSWAQWSTTNLRFYI